jgi:hypothetical protein
MDAPPDSTRSAGEFVLGTKGITAALKSYAERTNYCLYSIGTWHSHLAESRPSPKDIATAAIAAISRVAPSVFLIRTPKSYQAVIADGATISEEFGADKKS